MTLKRKDMSQPTSVWLMMMQDNVDEANVVPPKLKRRSPCALPLRSLQSGAPLGLGTLVSSTSSSQQRRRRIVTTARSAPRSRAAAAAQALAESVQQQKTIAQTNNSNHKSNDKQQQQQQQIRWPDVEEVERALDGCCLEGDALIAWKKADAHSNSKSHRSLDTTTSTLTYPSLPCDQQQQEQEQPPPQPPELVRVSTSTILGEQNELWRQIQLERQDYVGTTATTATVSITDNNNNNNNESQNLGSSQHTFNSYSNSSTHQQPQLRHLEPQQDLVVEFTKPRSSGKKAYVSPSPDIPTSPKPSSSTIRRYKGHSTFSDNSNKKETSEQPPPPSPSHSRGAKKQTAPGVTHHQRRRRRSKQPAAAAHTTESVFVPCPICQAPLEISKAPPKERVGIICYNCNAAASSELIRSFIGVSCNNSSNITTIEENTTDDTNPAL